MMPKLPSSLLLLPLLVGLVACQRETDALSGLEERLEALQSDVAETKQQAVQLRKELSVMVESRAKLEAVVDATRAEMAKAKAEQSSLEKAFADYRQSYHDAIIKRATGMELGDVAVGSQTLRQVSVKNLDAWEVALRHRSGVTRFALADLPDALKKLFGYDPSVGPKPSPDLASGLAPIAPSSSVEAVPSAPAASRPASMPASGSAPSTASAASPASKEKSPGEAGGSIVTFQGVGGSSVGSKVTGAKASVPQGYKPIGSNYSGTAMDRAHKKSDQR